MTDAEQAALRERARKAFGEALAQQQRRRLWFEQLALENLKYQQELEEQQKRDA